MEVRKAVDWRVAFGLCICIYMCLLVYNLSAYMCMCSLLTHAVHQLINPPTNLSITIDDYLLIDTYYLWIDLSNSL